MRRPRVTSLAVRLREVLGDGRVVGGGLGVGRAGQALPKLDAALPGPERREASLWALENLVEGNPVNPIRVAPAVAEGATVALERMLALRGTGSVSEHARA